MEQRGQRKQKQNTWLILTSIKVVDLATERCVQHAKCEQAFPDMQLALYS